MFFNTKVLWVNQEVFQILTSQAPDFKSVASTIIFNCKIDSYKKCIQEVAQEIFHDILEHGAGILWQSGMFAQEQVAEPDKYKGFLQHAQIEIVQRDLQQHKINLTPELDASLEFLLGHSSDISLEESDTHYQNSLALWRKIGNWRCEGCVLYCLGILYNTKAIANPSKYKNDFVRSKEYFEQCVKLFDRDDAQDLLAKFINALAEAYKRNALQEAKGYHPHEQWNELKNLAQRALELHQLGQQDTARFREARAWGFLSEVAIANQDWPEAKKLAEQACSIFNEVLINEKHHEDIKNWEISYHYGWYLLPLAKANKNLSNTEESIIKLKEAKKFTDPQSDPWLYIEILEELRDCYQKTQQYLEAFCIKQEQQSIKQQFGFQAFSGLNPLKDKQAISNKALLSSIVSQKPIVTLRKEQANKLTNKIILSENKILIIYGPSGCGKSSFLQAELIPLLQEKSPDGRKILPILVQNYGDWYQEIICSLKRALDCTDPMTDSVDDNLEQLLIKLYHQNFLTIIIFDELEGSVSIFADHQKREEFYQFCQQCLSLSSSSFIPFVKIIVSLREDYLQYLFEYDRWINKNLESAGYYIFDKKNFHYLDNFSPEEAKQQIKILKESTSLSLEDELIDKLVEDLAKQSGKVRPIELQLVGCQMEKHQITTLEAYQKLSSWYELIKYYVEEVIEDCGSKDEDKKVTRLTLYLLTRETNIRLLITEEELINHLREVELLETDIEKLSWILDILVASRLVIRSPELSVKQYQLAHDYLIKPIRYIANENHPRRLKKLTETKGKLRQIAKLRELDSEAEGFLKNYNQLDALRKSVDLGEELQKGDETVSSYESSREISNLKTKNLHRLRQLVDDIQEFNRLQGHESDVYRVSFSPDGKKLASASWDKKIKIWSLDGFDGTLPKTLEGHENCVNSVRFSPDGKWLVSAGGDKIVKLWNLEDSSPQNLGQSKDWHTDWVWDVRFSPDSKIIASASSDKTIKLWRLDGTLIDTLEEHEGRVYSLSFSSDGKFLASSSDDHTLKIWRRNKKDKYVLKTSIPCYDSFHCVALSPDGKIVVAGGWDKSIKLWKLGLKKDNSFQKLESFAGHSDCVNSLSFSPDGKFLASASNDNTVKLWHFEYGTCIKTFRGHSEWVRDVSFMPKKSYSTQPIILASCSDDNTVRIWKYEPYLWISNKDHTAKVHSAIFSPQPDSFMIASAGWDHTIRLLNFKENVLKTALTMEGHTDWVWEASFSQDGQVLASASGDQTVKIWGIDGVQTLKGHKSCVHSVSFSPDGQLLASGGEDIKLWLKDKGVWRSIKSLNQHQDMIWQVSFRKQNTSDGCFLLISASADKTIKLWFLKLDNNLVEINRVETLEKHQEWVNSVSFSPDGTKLASAANDGEIIIWDLQEGNNFGKDCKTIRGHTARIHDIAFSKDNLLATASADHTIKLWHLDGTLLKTLEGHSEEVNSVNFSPDGKRLVSASSDKTVKVWNLESIKKIPITESNETDDLAQLIERGEQWLAQYRRSLSTTTP